MANPISEEIQENVRELIAKITHKEVGSDQFATLEKCVLTTLKKSDTMYFLNTKDIKRAIWSMSEKFMFHGFFKHAEYLQQSHDKYIDQNLTESELMPRLNIVKFLLCMSENPTTFFWKEPDKFNFINENKLQEEVVDWGAYLNEGIERWSPIKEDSFQESDSEDEIESVGGPHHGGAAARTVITATSEVQKYDFQACRKELLETVQNGWYGGQVVCMQPPSDWFDANVGILWEQHLQGQVKNLIELEPVTVISEYKVMRELLWQMWGPHTSTVFQIQSNKLVPKANVTISSVCSMTFEAFLDVFVPYIEVLDDFRRFFKALEAANICETYKSYGCSLKKITKNIFEELIVIEKEVRDQETTMTLLKLAEKFEKIFQPVYILKTIHQEVIIDGFQNCAPLECALTLLTRLRKNLHFSLNKKEQDIRLTLYLESLFYYLAMTNAWLVKNDLFDHTQEFIILNKNAKASRSENCGMNFILQENVEDFCKEDPIVRIISDQVLQIGRNIHLLRLLGKFDVFVARDSETIHEEFIRRILEELSAYYDLDISEAVPDSPKVQKVASYFDLNEMGDWTNFVDLSDGFLTKAFDDFYLEKTEITTKPTLFDRITNITTNLFPLQNLPEKVFAQILKDRFTISGLMVKNLLIENYSLDKQFEFFNHIFLFWDDLVFAFYRRLFEKMNIASSNWGNSVWLTSHLQDVVMDLYPNFYENCTVQVKDDWKQCRDSLEACTLISLQYEIKWPLSIIITEKHIVMYKELFQFILKLKWALYTINHLFFTDLEPKSKPKKPLSSKTAIKRLKYLRFNLINILNSIQHYIFGFVFTKQRIQFELDFEKSTDLKSLITSHEDFVKSIHRSVSEIRDKKCNGHGFNTLLRCVKMLKVMWNELKYATGDNLDNCHRIYQLSSDVVNTIINPVFVFDY